MAGSEMVERHRTHGALAAASRVRLLDALRAGEHGLDARELAAACGLHVTTVRFHLDVLREAGLVRSESVRAGARGRPRVLYTPASGRDPGDPPGTDSYQMLASALAAHWTDPSPEPGQRAEQAGWAIAEKHRLAPPSTGGPSAEQAVAQVSGLFAELGFEPELTHDGDDLQIRLHACPFSAVAREHPDVVCTMHLGLLRGALAGLGAPVTVIDLTPFVGPHLCIAHLAPGTESTSPAFGAGRR
ncbi:helix-turn-helix transcriptional regulator [Pseudonocardia acidicola]|uniref:Helix-turn-helix domain-containing protein n=1 Tax=Pseudonocardia acidicola TaxID=2724939 RepID=A0ABX1SD76_9PSEU|nr:helix-turn-helix domain-containing protein [Pseudonocardia acidicola]NMH99519.1 helix-turn-helix domain-containing protein [Pseudonocardia acidicola]